jgi:6-phosphogluconate dehydrogenase
MHSVFKAWNNGKLESFLVKITSDILVKKDDKEEGYLVDHILDMARQKGTGKWTSQVAMDLQVPVPSIDIAVAMRHLSAFKKEREEGEDILIGPENKIKEKTEAVIEKLENALYFSMLVTYAQGMELLRIASNEKEFGLHLDDVARIWRGGCIIRADLLNNLLKAFKNDPSAVNVLLDQELAEIADRNEPDTRSVILYAAEAGIPVPGIMSAIGYFDAYRSSWLPDNLIQAQRDYFGSHTYERVDRDGVFHTEW